jgi:hypothetical protein
VRLIQHLRNLEEYIGKGEITISRKIHMQVHWKPFLLQFPPFNSFFYTFKVPFENFYFKIEGILVSSLKGKYFELRFIKWNYNSDNNEPKYICFAGGKRIHAKGHVVAKYEIVK